MAKKLNASDALSQLATMFTGQPAKKDNTDNSPKDTPKGTPKDTPNNPVNENATINTQTSGTPVSAPEYTTLNAPQAIGDANSAYSKPAQKAAVNENKDMQDTIADSYAARANEDLRGNDNRALWRASPFGNYNGLNYDDTLKFSRLADNLNNRLWWTPQGITAEPSNSEIGTGTQKPPITTEEMRRMQTARDVYANQLKQEVNLQGDINSMPLEALGDAREYATSFANAVNVSENDMLRAFQQSIFDTEYVSAGTQYWNEIAVKFAAQFKNNMTAELYNMYIKMLSTSPELAAIFQEAYNIGSSKLNLSDVMLAEFEAQAVSVIDEYMPNASADEKTTAVSSLLGQLTYDYAAGWLNAGSYGLTPGKLMGGSKGPKE